MQGVCDRTGMPAQPLHGGFAGQHAQQSKKRDDGWCGRPDGYKPIKNADSDARAKRQQIGHPTHCTSARAAYGRSARAPLFSAFGWSGLDMKEPPLGSFLRFVRFQDVSAAIDVT